jgi:hypothetical protein
MTRMVGGTFGVAVLGALITAVGRDRLSVLLPQASGPRLDRLSEALGAGGTGGAGTDPTIAAATKDAFVTALHTGMRVGAAVLAAGAVVAFVTISSRRPAKAEGEAVAPVEIAA